MNISNVLSPEEIAQSGSLTHSLKAEFVYIDLLETIQIDIDLLITRGQIFYEKKNKNEAY